MEKPYEFGSWDCRAWRDEAKKFGQSDLTAAALPFYDTAGSSVSGFHGSVQTVKTGGGLRCREHELQHF
jgi:hypothetical protein